MKPPKDQIEKLEQALIRAHAMQDAPQFSTGWGYAVMRDIRQHASHMRVSIEMPRLMWRAATIVAFVSIMVVGSVLAWNAERADAGFEGFFTATTVDLSLL